MILFVHERLDEPGEVRCGCCLQLRPRQGHRYRVPGSALYFCGPCRRDRPGACQAAAEAEELSNWESPSGARREESLARAGV